MKLNFRLFDRILIRLPMGMPTPLIIAD